MALEYDTFLFLFIFLLISEILPHRVNPKTKENNWKPIMCMLFFLIVYIFYNLNKEYYYSCKGVAF